MHFPVFLQQFPSHIRDLLSEFCQLTNEEFNCWWAVLKDIVWLDKDPCQISRGLMENEKTILQLFGPEYGKQDGSDNLRLKSISEWD